MKRLCFKKDASKRGVASLYVVIFTTILFGVVTLSFMRIILSEAGQSSDDDLSRSAYDSAMAGVEDAKMAVNRYYQCLQSNNANAEGCQRSLLFQKDCDSGIGLAKYLYGGNYTDGEVKIQETDNHTDAGLDNNSDQAYTCVVVSDVVPDYRGTLSSDTRTKVIPVKINNGATSGTENKPIDKIKFDWYSILNEGTGALDPNGLQGVGSTDLPNGDNLIVPPVIHLTYIHVRNGGLVNIDDFHKANNGNNYTYSTVILRPNKIGDGANVITRGALANAGNISTGDNNSPFGVTCSTVNDFACSVELTGLNIDTNDNAFIVVSLPYGDTVTDFATTLYGSDGKPIKFVGVQISVDSTGRTNQLVRRVESRLDPADLFFPYPQYEIEATGGADDAIKKNFWITANCWYQQPGKGGSCNNNGELNNS